MSKDILFEEMPGLGGSIGLVTLNRPEVLNSLNENMVTSLYQQLQDWGRALYIKAVVIRAAESKAFCAGGDIRMVYDKARDHMPSMTDFFFEEYQLNRAIYHFPKPYIAFMDGITMGGGVGVSMHGSHRVGTERLLFAMPETGIGFFPDVGGTYFLPRMPHYCGYYLGLTGARIKIADAVALGVVTQHISHARLPEVLKAIAETKLGAHPKQSVTEILNTFHQPTDVAPIEKSYAEITHCFKAHDIETILQRLQASSDALCQEAYQSMLKKSPTSLKVTLAALQHGLTLDFDGCMRQEYRLVTRFLLAHDFIEGIRAVIIDKDQSPSWSPASLADVSASSVSHYFEPLQKELVE